MIFVGIGELFEKVVVVSMVFPPMSVLKLPSFSCAGGTKDESMRVGV